MALTVMKMRVWVSSLTLAMALVLTMDGWKGLMPMGRRSRNMKRSVVNWKWWLGWMRSLGPGSLVAWIKARRRDRTGRGGGGVSACVCGLRVRVTVRATAWACKLSSAVALFLACYGGRHVSLAFVVQWLRPFARNCCWIGDGETRINVVTRPGINGLVSWWLSFLSLAWKDIWISTYFGTGNKDLKNIYLGDLCHISCCRRPTARPIVLSFMPRSVQKQIGTNHKKHPCWHIC